MDVEYDIGWESIGALKRIVDTRQCHLLQTIAAVDHIIVIRQAGQSCSKSQFLHGTTIFESSCSYCLNDIGQRKRLQTRTTIQHVVWQSGQQATSLEVDTFQIRVVGKSTSTHLGQLATSGKRYRTQRVHVAESTFVNGCY